MARYDLELLAGGFHPVRSYWRDLTRSRETSAKLYVVTRGEARYALGDRWTTLRAGNAYLLPPHPAQRYECRHEADMYWLHFLPASLLLRRRLAGLGRIHAWPLRRVPRWRPVYTALPAFFHREAPELGMRIQAMLLEALADAFAAGEEGDDGADADRERFAPAIAFMDDQFLANPPLARISAAAGLSPVHFHRRFVRAFATTPHAYMEAKRMELARQMVLAGDDPIRSVAAACGYGDPLYFSRVFSRHHRLSPQQARRSPAFAGP